MTLNLFEIPELQLSPAQKRARDAARQRKADKEWLTEQQKDPTFHWKSFEGRHEAHEIVFGMLKRESCWQKLRDWSWNGALFRMPKQEQIKKKLFGNKNVSLNKKQIERLDETCRWLRIMRWFVCPVVLMGNYLCSPYCSEEHRERYKEEIYAVHRNKEKVVWPLGEGVDYS
jgi:hypothetical protein